MANSFMWMATSMKGTGLTTKPTAMAPISMSTEHVMRANGKMIYSMVRARRLGLMARYTRDSTFQARSTASEYTVGTMARAMRVNGMKIRYAASVHTHGSMAVSTRGSGLTTTWRVWASTHGKMGDGMRGSTVMTRSTAMVSTLGLMDVNIKECGSAGSNTD